jgi:tellurite resistance protein
MQELTFKTIYNSPFIEALAGLRAPHADALKARARDEAAAELLERQIAAIRAREAEGGFAEAVIRIMLASAKAQRMVDARGFRLAQQLRKEHPRLKDLSHERLKAIAREEAFMIRFDEERALASLPELLPTEQDRREALDLVRKVGGARGEMTPESEAVLRKIEEILGLHQSSGAPAEERAAPVRRIRATAK